MVKFKIIDTVKKYPIPVLGGLAVAIFILTRGSDSGGVSDSVQIASINASRDIAVKRLETSAEKKAAFKAKWEEYSRLPPDEKEKFAQQAIKDSAAKTALSNNATPLAPPTHSANPAANAGAEPTPHPTEAPSPEVSSPP